MDMYMTMSVPDNIVHTKLDFYVFLNFFFFNLEWYTFSPIISVTTVPLHFCIVI
jgi:hypothetical protein